MTQVDIRTVPFTRQGNLPGMCACTDFVSYKLFSYRGCKKIEPSSKFSPDNSNASRPVGPPRVLPRSDLIEMYEEAEFVHAALMLVCTWPCALQI